MKNVRDYEVTLAGELAACGVGYFDYYLLHALTEEVYERHERLGGFDFQKKGKSGGVFKKNCFSFHDKPELLEKILIEHDEIDFVQLQINYLDWESPVICSGKCYEIARKYGKTIMVMEPLKGGSLTKKIRIGDREFTEKELADISLSFVANLPGISVILSGMSKIELVTHNRETIAECREKDTDAHKEEYDYQVLRGAVNRTKLIPCKHCNYCTNECGKILWFLISSRC